MPASSSQVDSGKPGPSGQDAATDDNTAANTAANIRAASILTVGELLALQALRRPKAIAVEEGGKQITYAQFNERVNRLAHVLSGMGVRPGERVGILSENRTEYLELALACGKMGAILCALNWRLAAPELEHCVRLTSPRVVAVSSRHRAALEGIGHGAESLLGLDDGYEEALAAADASEPGVAVHPEDGLYILYTSGTTGLPKGALISHRAQIARMTVNILDLGLNNREAFIAWPPMFHMASLDQGTHTLSIGGKVIVVDGLDPERICAHVEAGPQWWFPMLPGTVEQFNEEARRRNLKPGRARRIGAMADLVPVHQIAEATRLFGAPYVNSFGSTETGIPPLSGAQIPVGEVPKSLAKRPSSLSSFRLVDPEDNDVPDGTPGELAFRGPTLFSGYWNAPETNATDFRGGWFHLGDMFIRHTDGSYDFVDRLKYLIKSGGENVYPAEIERVLLGDSRVEDAVVVRRADAKWGEVPIAFVARRDDSLTGDDLAGRCRDQLAGYKQPKEIRFVPFEDLPRSTTGKIQRHEVEKWLEE